MKLLRSMMVLIQAAAIILYPQLMHGSMATQFHPSYESTASLDHADAGSHVQVNDTGRAVMINAWVAGSFGSSPDPRQEPGGPDPCCAVTGGLCFTALVSSSALPAVSGRCALESTPPAAVSDLSSAPLPHPPKSVT